MATKKVSTQSVTKKVEEKQVVAPATTVEAAKTEKEAAKKAPAKKTTTKKTTTKRTTTKAQNEFVVEFNGAQVSVDAIMQRIEENWTEQGNTKTSLKGVKVYIQPETNKVYYVVAAGTAKEQRGEIDFF